MGVPVVPIAREMLHNAPYPVLRQAFQGSRHKLACGHRVGAQRAIIEEGSGSLGDIAHRGQIHVEPQAVEQIPLFPFHGQYHFHAAGSIGLPGGWKFFFPEGGMAADPAHRSALLIHSQKHRDVGCILVAVQSGPQALRGLIIKVPSEEEEAAQVIRLNILSAGLPPAAAQEHLPHLFFQGHRVELLPEHIPGRLCFRRRLGHSGLRDSRLGCCLLRSQGRNGLGASRQQQGCEQDQETLFHTASNLGRNTRR